jgi:hypothetical protein
MWMRRQWIWIAAIGGAANAVAMNRRLLVERLLADLVPFISDPNTVLALAKVVSAKWSQAAVRENQQGVIALEIVEVFRGPSLKAIEIHGERLADEQARFKSSFNQWNVLRFEPGDLLLMALRQGSGSWQALAAQQVSSLQDPAIPALRRAVEIERMEAGARRPALEQALRSHEDLLRDYAVDAIDRRRVTPRDTGAAMLAGAAAAPDTPVESKVAFVKALAARNYFQYELGSDPVNLLIVRTIAGLLAQADAKRGLLWTQFLGSTVAIQFSKDAAKDAEIRRSLIRGVTDPPPERVIAALAQQVSGGSKDPRAAKLLQHWRGAW